MITKPKGTLDFLPNDAVKRHFIEEKLRELSSVYNYREIRTPSFEKTSLFKRSIGEETDVVSKEMYSFHNDEFTLKPEMTAPVIRAYVENSMYNESPVQKLYYIANMYRHERPQAGRFREFSQFGAEAIGSDDYTVDVDLISLGKEMLNVFGISNVIIKINTIGTISERSVYIEELKKYVYKYHGELTEESRMRLEKNPLRILDTKNEREIQILKDAPVLFSFLNNSTREHFNKVLEGLSNLGIKYETDHHLVRGFDYYTSTTFEVISPDLGAQNAIFGGGRYDMLVEQLGGKKTPAIGFACGLERLTMIMETNSFNFPADEKLILYIVSAGEKAKEKALIFCNELRRDGIKCETDYLNRSVKSQMKEANKLNAVYTIVIGDEEIKSNTIKIKRMSDGFESAHTTSEISSFFKNLHE